MRLDPVRYALRADTQLPTDPMQVVAINIQLNRLLAQFITVPSPLWLWRVLLPSAHTAIPLTVCFGDPGSILSFCALAVWTLLHVPILPHAQRFGHSLHCDPLTKTSVHDEMM